LEDIKAKKLTRSGISQKIMQKVESNFTKLSSIQNRLSIFVDKLNHSGIDDIKDLLNQIFQKEEDEEALGDAGSLNMSNKVNALTVNGSQTNMSLKISQLVQKDQKKHKNAKNIKIKNRRSQESLGHGKAWFFYVNKICGDRYVRDLSNDEQEAVAKFIFTSLTKITENESEKLNVLSLKKFIANAIDYV
jgi:hypothetical protein